METIKTYLKCFNGHFSNEPGLANWLDALTVTQLSTTKLRNELKSQPNCFTRKFRRCRGRMDITTKTVGTVTRTAGAGILIHSRLEALAVNLSQPSTRLWLYAGLIVSNNPRWLKADFAVCVNPSSSSCV